MAKPQAKVWQFSPQSAEEQEALARLKPSWGTRKHRRAFQQAVLNYLAFIPAFAEGKRARNSPIARIFRRRAETIRHFVERMERPLPSTLAPRLGRRISSWPPTLPWFAFPSRELLLHADTCDSWASWFAELPRRPASEQNRQIVRLLNFLLLHTGKTHLKDLAALLKRPCGDAGMTAARLDQLLRDHAERSEDVRREIEDANSGIMALVARQSFGAPQEI